MPNLRLYNTATRQKEDFTPLDKENVRLYVCGPTVYDHAHIGNARPVIVFDVLYRLLRHRYGVGSVTYARNITDVDDKIIERAARDGVDIAELTKGTAKEFQSDMLALGCLAPDIEPRATDHIPQMVAMIEILIEKEHAYPDGDGHVLFSVSSWEGYGALANRSLKEMVAGARVEVATNKRDPMDFVLWKPSTGDQPGWDSPWGKGRPGWHIECSAMSKAHLGDCIDIHGGGLDLIFPHHQNEVAQSVCANGGCGDLDGRQDFAKVWMHNGYLQVEGSKMSKSEGNFLTVNGLLEDWPGEVLRLQMLMTHYRSPLDWTEGRLKEARDTLDRWYKLTDGVVTGEVPDPVIAALSDDMNTPALIAELHKLTSSPAELKAAGQFVGLFQKTAEDWFDTSSLDEKQIEKLIAARIEARTEKNWEESDRIRDELVAMGVQLQDSKNPETGEFETIWELKR